jgi:signal transduction histidine kinase
VPRLNLLFLLRAVIVLMLAGFVLVLLGVARDAGRTTPVPLSVSGLDGLGVSMRELPPEALDPDQTPVADPRMGPPRYFTLTLSVPETLQGRRAWLRLQPAFIGQAVLRVPGQPDQLTGSRLPREARSHRGSTGLLRVSLDAPQRPMVLLVQTTAPRLVQLQLLGEAELQNTLSLSNLFAGLFFGACLLVTLLATTSWLGSGNTLYRDFAVYLACCIAVSLFVNAELAAQWQPLGPEAFARGAMLVYGLYSASGTLLALRLLGLEAARPVAPALRRLLLLMAGGTVLLGVLAALSGRVAPFAMPALLLHALAGLLLVVLALRNSWRSAEARTALVALALLVNSLFEKSPVLAMYGLMPLQADTYTWPMIGTAAQMLLVHLLLVMQLREQQQLAQANALAQLEAAKERTHRETLLRFLAMFGHEVRTPLAVIDSSTQSLELLPGADRPEHQRRHRRIRDAIARLQSLANEALSRERIEAKGWLAAPRPVTLRGLLTELLPRHGYELPQAPALPSGVPVSVGLGHIDQRQLLQIDCRDLDQPFLGDPAMLRMALDNLLDNAAKYSTPGSPVQLHIDLLPHRASRPQLRFAVLNHGAPLSPAEQTRAFEKYWRSGEQHSIGGAGLGLYLVKLVAEAQHGEVEASTLPDGRHRFSFSILWQPTTST